MQHVELVVSDMAGTTVHDDGQVLAAFTETLASAGVEVSADQLTTVRGAAKRDAIRALFPKGADLAQRTERTYEQFRERLPRTFISAGVSPIDGADQVFGSIESGVERDVAA
jgi:phosphoglycolate phosphatase